MRAVLSALFFFLAGCSAAYSESRSIADEWQTYRAFLKMPACGEATDEKACELTLDTWRRDFMWATDPSWNALLTGRRNIVFCLSTGCNGGVTINPTLACAWARVVVLSGLPEIRQSDFDIQDDICGQTNLTTAVERDAAEVQAKRILFMMGN